MNAAQLINQTSGEVEFYTPLEIVEAARRTMGRIDLDPASSAEANKRVMAQCFYTAEDDGLNQKWFGRVWMNHPFSREHNAKWINKLIAEFILGRVEQACCITFASTSEKWFQPLQGSPQCYLHPRTNYYLPDGTLKRGVSKGSVVTYLGPDLDLFAAAFSALGAIKVRYPLSL